MKPVRLSNHAQGHRASRGFSDEEVVTAIEQKAWFPAIFGTGRFECEHEFPFESYWNGKWYGTKKVRPVFIEMEFEIVVVTVYTYYY